MDEKKQILICKISDYHIGFDISSTTQIIKGSLKKVSLRNETIKFRNKRIPYVDIFKKLNCPEGEKKYIVVLNSEKGVFSTAVSSIVEIIDTEDKLSNGIGDGLKDLTITDYIKGVVIFADIPVVIVDSEKIFNFEKKKNEKKRKKRG
jgi:chemotaxis signal transduction protein